MKSKLESKLVGRGKALPKGARAVLTALQKAPELLSARDLCMRMKLSQMAGEKTAPGLTTIYRSLELLTRLGLAQAVSVGDGEARYEAVEAGEHSHHLICKGCSSQIKLKECLIASIEEIILREHGFSVTEHLLELFGHCKNCSKASAELTLTKPEDNVVCMDTKKVLMTNRRGKIR